MKDTSKTQRVKSKGDHVLHWFEIGLGLLALIAVAVITITQIIGFAQADWSQMETFMEVLKIILQLAIGVELARMLFSYSLNTIIELAVFIIARKMLLIEDDFTGVLLAVISLTLLFGVRYYFTKEKEGDTDTNEKDGE